MKRIVESMQRVLLRRIVENLEEADVAEVIPGEKVQIVLRAPEEPRFTPSGYTEDIEGEGDLVVSQDEFEKDYEVK